MPARWTFIAYAKNLPLNLYRTEEVDKITDEVTLKMGWDTMKALRSLRIPW